MGILNKPPSLASLNCREVKELEAIIRNLIMRSPGRFSEQLEALEKATDWVKRVQRPPLVFTLSEEAQSKAKRQEYRRVAALHAAVLEVAWPENPGSFVVPYKLCEFYSCLDRFDDALSVAQKLLERFPNDPRSSYALATVYHTLGGLGRVQESELTPDMLTAILTPEWNASSIAIQEACEKLALTPMQASELAA